MEETRPDKLPDISTDVYDSQAADRKHAPLIGVVGSMLSEPLNVIEEIFDEMVLQDRITSTHVNQVLNALGKARNVALQSQQIARLSSGRLRQSHEKLKLDDVLRDALSERASFFKQQGVDLHHSIKSVEVIVDAGLLVCLVDAALEWALSMGRKLVITLEMKNWPEHGILLIRSSQGFSMGLKNAPDMDDSGNTLAWYLMAETANVMGVSVHRVTTDRDTSLYLEFPRTVRRLQGLTAIEVDTEIALGGHSKPMAGHRMLVITNDDKLRNEFKNVARSLRMTCDFVTATWQGVRFCELDLPHLIVIDERVRDHIFDELHDDLRRADPNYPFIEIASEPNVLEMAGWLSDSMTRISQDSLRDQLATIISMELAKASDGD